MLAAVLNTLLPVIHFLTVTALGFVLSAVAVWAVRDRVFDPASTPSRFFFSHSVVSRPSCSCSSPRERSSANSYVSW